MEAIRAELGKQSIKDWIGPNVIVNVKQLDATRAWRDHIAELKVKLEGGLLKDDSGNHVFMSFLRRGRGLKKPEVVIFPPNLVILIHPECLQ